MEELQLGYLKDASADIQSHLSSAFEILCTEIGTEAHFTSHLSQLIDKMNTRRIEQEEATNNIRQELRESLHKSQSIALELVKFQNLYEVEVRSKAVLENEFISMKNALDLLKRTTKNNELSLRSLTSINSLAICFYIVGKNQELLGKLKQTTSHLDRQRSEIEHHKKELKIQESLLSSLKKDVTIYRDDYNVSQ